MLKPAAMFAALALVLSALSCRRPLSAKETDGGAEVGGPPVGDARPRDLPTAVVDGPADVSVADVSVADIAADVAVERAGDLARDAVDAVDAGAAICPAGVAPLDVCGCGCCGEAMGRACYYPSLGETRESIPNAIPPPTNCAMAGCSFGVRHLCCADPGARSGADVVCGIDTSLEDWARFTITRRVGDICTTLELGSGSPRLPIIGPPGYVNTNAWRAPCDGSKPPTYAIGGLGKVTPGTSGALLPFPRYDVHAVVFFDSGSGVADAVRIDKDDVAVSSLCTSDPCPACTGACAFDTTYTFTTSGGLAFYRTSSVLAPPASYVRYSRPEAGMGMELSCAPAFPACGGDAIDVADVMAALTDADVLEAFERSKGAGTWPFYGVDTRGGDGAASLILRDAGGGFLVGGQCPDAPTRPCTPIPAGLSRLVSMLVALDQQQIAADPSCTFTRP